jgi:hypothetical protein
MALKPQLPTRSSIGDEVKRLSQIMRSLVAMADPRLTEIGQHEELTEEQVADITASWEAITDRIDDLELIQRDLSNERRRATVRRLQRQET